MLFSSPVFLFLFLPALLGLYVVCPGRGRNLLLLVGSLFFYAWGELGYVAVLLASIALNYGCGLALGAMARGGSRRRWALASGLTANVLLLGYYKYAGFLVTSWLAVSGTGPADSSALAAIHLPLGISFFTFQGISYLMDVYRGEARAQRNPLDVAVYIAMFPQLIAGPIVRYGSIADQISDRVHSLASVDSGLRRFVIGLARKMLLANPLGETADQIFAQPGDELSMAAAWLGTTCYAFQIYYDFSGYSDMAIGLGRVLGFRFPENFADPYASTSIREFWRRWHMTLSSWFRDYLYIPMGGNRAGGRRTALHLLIVFFLCGLWHGASWNFVVWGLFHGTLLSVERTGWGVLLERLWRPLRHLYVVVMVWIGWVIFRLEDLASAGRHLEAMFGFGSGRVDLSFFLEPRLLVCLLAGAVLATPIGRVLRERREKALDLHPEGRFLSEAWRSAAILVLATICLAFVASSTYNPFIYFRF